MRRNLKLATLVSSFFLVAVALPACGSSSRSTQSGSSAQFPMQVSNCGQNVTIPRAPKRVVTIDSDAVDLVAVAGGLDRIVGQAGNPSDPVFYSPAVVDKMRKVRVLGSGGYDFSLESLLSVKPDLLVGSESFFSRDQLNGAGIPLLAKPGFCGKSGSEGTIDFDTMKSFVGLLGSLFGTEGRATEAVNSITRRVDAVRRRPIGQGRTAAALFLTQSKLAAYGGNSMAEAQFDVLGLKNIFANVPKRYFEPSLEQIVSSNPDVIVALSYPAMGKLPPQTIDFLKSFPGMSSVAAVQHGDVLFMQYAYSSSGPTAVQGLERIAKRFGTK